MMSKIWSNFAPQDLCSRRYLGKIFGHFWKKKYLVKRWSNSPHQEITFEKISGEIMKNDEYNQRHTTLHKSKAWHLECFFVQLLFVTIRYHV